MIWTIWSELSYKSITDFEKDNKKKEKKISERINKNETRTKKRTVNNQWIENISIIKKQIFLRMIVKKKNYVFIVRKKNIKSKNAEVYKKNQQKHKHE